MKTEDYSGWVFIDLLDLQVKTDTFLTTDGKPRSIKCWLDAFPGCLTKGSRQPLKGGEWKDTTHLSITYSSVTSTLLDRCPKLEWVVARGHSYNSIDLNECRNRGLGVVSLGIFTNNCSRYILNHLGPPPYVFYGCGRIPRKTMEVLDDADVYMINTSTSEPLIEELLGRAGTLIASVPIPRDKKPVFTKRLFAMCQDVKFVSICHEPLMDNVDLQYAVDYGHVKEAVVDSLWPKDREELLATGKVNWTNDRAYSTNFDYDVNIRYVKSSIAKTLAGDFEGIILPPTGKRAGFQI